MVKSRFPKTFFLLLPVIVAIGYWQGSRPVQTIDWSIVQKDIPATNKEPTDFLLQDLKGTQISLSQFREKPIVLNFWATWCPPCIEEFPSFFKFSEWAQKTLGVIVLAISVDTNWDVIRTFFQKHHFWPKSDFPFTVLLNPDGGVAQNYGSSKFPETFVIDRNFKIIRKFEGTQDWSHPSVREWFTSQFK